ncbi:MAG: hypothetical protein HKO53_12800 [Gemmatimonadetes bacterium]|nr:hypothetical protein [Gemmatimonadota bacterium]
MPVELVLGGLALSPGEKHLAYGVTRMFTMFFQGEQGYVVSAGTPTRGPYRIASSIWAVRWGKTHLYAAVGEPGARGIYRWALTEFPD